MRDRLKVMQACPFGGTGGIGRAVYTSLRYLDGEVIDPQVVAIGSDAGEVAVEELLYRKSLCSSITAVLSTLEARRPASAITRVGH